jgi:hypothetical protein
MTSKSKVHTPAFAPAAALLPRGTIAPSPLLISASSLVPQLAKLHVASKGSEAVRSRPVFCPDQSRAPKWTVVRAAAPSTAVIGDAPVPYQRVPADHIRTVSIIAHVDHGKSAFFCHTLQIIGFHRQHLHIDLLPNMRCTLPSAFIVVYSLIDARGSATGSDENSFRSRDARAVPRFNGS